MKVFKCPFDNKKYTEKNGLYDHIEKNHSSEIPEGTSVAQFYFNLRNKKTHGTCTICGEESNWNEATEHYERFCTERCRALYREEFKKRMIDKHGKVHLLNDPDQQKKMLKNRSISGEYLWSNGKTKTEYTGSYEHDFLKFLDNFMSFNPSDIIAPAPQVFYYNDTDGTKRFYIPDFYIPSINTLVEIKDGGSNPNNHHNRKDIDGRKEKIKDEIMTKQKNYNFIKVTDKNYAQFINFLINVKNTNMSDAKKEKSPVIMINESTFELLESILLGEEINNEGSIAMIAGANRASTLDQYGGDRPKPIKLDDKDFANQWIGAFADSAKSEEIVSLVKKKRAEDSIYSDSGTVLLGEASKQSLVMKQLIWVTKQMQRDPLLRATGEMSIISRMKSIVKKAETKEELNEAERIISLNLKNLKKNREEHLSGNFLNHGLVGKKIKEKSRDNVEEKLELMLKEVRAKKSKSNPLNESDLQRDVVKMYLESPLVNLSELKSPFKKQRIKKGIGSIERDLKLISKDNLNSYEKRIEKYKRSKTVVTDVDMLLLGLIRDYTAIESYKLDRELFPPEKQKELDPIFRKYKSEVNRIFNSMEAVDRKGHNHAGGGIESLSEDIDIDADGSMLINLKERSDFMSKYNTSHRLLKIYMETGNNEGVKHELCKLWYMYIIIERYYNHEQGFSKVIMTPKRKTSALKAKAFILNDFTTSMRWLLKREPNFNFDGYFAETPYNKDVIKLDTDKIKGIKKLIQALLV